MARQDINTEFNTFVGGILTEANPINYPKGFTQDEENFILERNGTRRRRRGLDFESGFTDGLVREVGVVNSVGYDHLLWGDDQLVIWDSEKVSVYDIDTSGTISTSHTAIITSSGTSILGISQYQDYLMIAREGSNNRSFTDLAGLSFTYNSPEILIYDKTPTLVDTIVLRVRDFVGIDDGTDNQLRPGTLSNEHYYNLLNQGWSTTNIAQYFTDTATYPSRADSQNSGLDAQTGAFTSTWVTLANNGFTNTSKGRYPIDLLLAGVNRTDHLNTADATTTGTLTSGGTGGTIDDMAEHVGRMFYLVNSDANGETGRTVLCFSGAGVKTVELGNCYQTNDPTSRDTSQLLDSDGGHLDISSVGRGYKIVSLKDRLFIFGSKGVFELFSIDSVFKPATIAIRKIAQDGALPPGTTAGGSVGRSVTVAEDSIFYFAKSGVMQIVYDFNSGMYTSVNISSTKIQTLYNAIAEDAKANAEGVYVASDQTVRFLYNDFTGGDIQYRDTELVYDLVLKAWYKNTFVTAADEDTAFYPIFPFLAQVNVAQSDYPVDDSLRYAVLEISTSVDKPYRFCSYTDTNFEDFDAGGAARDAAAFMQTGYINAGDTQRHKQANYIVPSFIRTEDGFTDDGGGNLTPNNESSCDITAYWDYADTTAGGKIGTAFEAYRYNRLYIPSGAADTFNYGQSVITTKNKLLGRGRALSLRFESSAGKDLRLLGWGLGFETNTKV